MALLNRNLKWKEADEIPLMDKTEDKILADSTVNLQNDNDDDEIQEKPFKQHDITLWLSDAIVLVIEHLQYFGVLLALSEHWGWPMKWINATAFTFIFNFDIWEFRKVETGAFNHSRTSFIDSSKLGFNYASYLAAWAVILCITAAVFGGIYFRWMRRRPLYLLLYVARWKRVMFLVLQFLCIPFGVAAARVFHCRKDVAKNTYVMDVQNEFTCYREVHIAFMILVAILFIFLFLVYPLILSKWIKEQVFSNDPVRHEGSLQLKEAEYEQGLDILWDFGQYHLFSSFKRAWIYYNSQKFFFKLLLIAGFASSVKSTFWSSAGITVLFCIAVVALIFKRAFRVRCFNVMIICSHFIIAANALIGNFMVRPPWEDPQKFQIVSFLRYPTIMNILIAINLSWVGILVLWVFYLFLLNNGLISSERIWPRLSYDSSNTIGEDTKKYLKAALKARHTLEHALSAIPLFAPIHELSHQVQVINAYCREAEYISDPTHDTLWDLLDELIEAHNALAPVSVFGMSGKNSVKETSEEFIKLMPSFRKRLKQREYDFVLVPPVKRRLLLKMYILSVFVNNKQKKASPDEEVTTKLQEALAMFDSRSLDYYDTGFSSTSPSSISAYRESPPMSEQFSSRAPSDMTGFLNDVEKLVGYDERNGKTSVGFKKRSTASSDQFYIGSPPSSARNKEESRSATPQSHKSSTGPRLISPRGNQVSPAFMKTPPRNNRISPLPSEESHAQENKPSRPGTAPLSPVPRISPISVSRPGTAPSRSRTSTPAYFAPSQDMSSTLSIPGQVEEEEEHDAIHNNTILA